MQNECHHSDLIRALISFRDNSMSLFRLVITEARLIIPVSGARDAIKLEIEEEAINPIEAPPKFYLILSALKCALTSTPPCGEVIDYSLRNGIESAVVLRKLFLFSFHIQNPLCLFSMPFPVHDDRLSAT